MLYATSHGGLTPFSRPRPITHCKNSVCVLDLPLDLHNPAHPFSSGPQRLSRVVRFTKRRSSYTLSYVHPAFLTELVFSCMGKPSLLCYLTRSPLLPPDGRAGGGRTKGQTADRCAQPATCTHARSPTPFGPRHQSKTGRLTWQSRAGPRAKRITLGQKTHTD